MKHDCWTYVEERGVSRMDGVFPHIPGLPLMGIEAVDDFAEQQEDDGEEEQAEESLINYYLVGGSLPTQIYIVIVLVVTQRSIGGASNCLTLVSHFNFGFCLQKSIYNNIW